MPNPHSIKPCITHAWTSSTANGWRVCPTCKQAQRLIDGEWTVLTAPSAPNKKKDNDRQWRIDYLCGFSIECVRKNKPTRLAESWSNSQMSDGTSYGAYTIREVQL